MPAICTKFWVYKENPGIGQKCLVKLSLFFEKQNIRMVNI